MSQGELPTSHSTFNLNLTDRARGSWPRPGELPRTPSSASQRSLTPSRKSPRSPRSPRSPGTPRSQRRDVCDTCDSLWLERRDELPFGQIIPLGVFKDLEQRKEQCQLCRLVHRLLKQSGADKSKYDHKVTLSLKPSREDIAVLCTEVAPATIQDVPHTEIRGWIRMITPTLSTSSSFVSIASEISLLSLSDTSSRRGGGYGHSLRGRILRSKQIDFGQIRDWLHECETQHDDTCNMPHSETTRAGGRSLAGMLLIDVGERKVVTAPSGAKFAALSYVWGKWGGQKVIYASSSNIAFLRTPGALNGIHLPVVVRDAMDLVSRIGLRYLWCDLLCIVQDNTALRDQQISQMDVIYSKSHLTLVALTGEHGNDELPGVREGTKRKEICSLAELSSGTKFIARPPCLDFIRTNTIYEHRGWTFQERLMSRRCLYLTDRQIYFQCPSGCHREDENICAWGPSAYRESKRLQSSPQDIATRMASLNGFSLYDDLLHEYTGRVLSKDSDVLNAFSAIIKTLERAFETSFVCGLPALYLDHALLWAPTSLSHYRFWDPVLKCPRHRVLQLTSTSTSPEDPDADPVPPPTWSWAAWKGQMHHLQPVPHPHDMQHTSASPLEFHYLQPCVAEFGIMGAPDGNVRALPRHHHHRRRNHRVAGAFNWRSLAVPRRALPGYDAYAIDYLRTVTHLIRQLFHLLADHPSGRWARASTAPNADWPWEDSNAAVRAGLHALGLREWTHLRAPSGAELFDAYVSTGDSAHIEHKAPLPAWPFHAAQEPEKGPDGAPALPKPWVVLPRVLELEALLRGLPPDAAFAARPDALCFWAWRRAFSAKQVGRGQLYWCGGGGEGSYADATATATAAAPTQQQQRLTTADGRYSATLAPGQLAFAGTAGAGARVVEVEHEVPAPATLLFERGRRRPCGVLFERERDVAWRVRGGGGGGGGGGGRAGAFREGGCRGGGASTGGASKEGAAAPECYLVLLSRVKGGGYGGGGAGDGVANVLLVRDAGRGFYERVAVGRMLGREWDAGGGGGGAGRGDEFAYVRVA